MTDQGKSIALVVLDTLRKDYFDRHFDWLPGRRFNNAYSTSQWTVPAHASIFTGMYPSEVGVHSKNTQFDCPDPSIAEILNEHGYTTRGFSANPNVSGHFGFDRGFDLFESPEELLHLNSPQIVNWQSFVEESPHSGVPLYLHGLWECVRGDWKTLKSVKSGIKQVFDDDSLKNPGGTKDSIQWVRQQDFGGQEFVFINLMEAHEPYEAPDNYMEGDTPELTNSIGDLTFDDTAMEEDNRDRVQTAYDSCARYLSDQYQELFSELSNSFDYVISLADHGEMLGEHDAWGHEHGVYPELINVPLVVSGDEMSGESDEVVSLVDIAATITELAGITDDHASRGRPLTMDGTKRDVLTEYTGLTPWSEERLLESDHPKSLFEKYDEKLYGVAITNGSYAYQTGKDLDITGDRVNDAAERLQDLVSDLDVREVSAQNDTIPDGVRQQLEDLGYA